MIVSHDHRFIFLKTRKTAGTSVEISLSRYCGPMDVITAISPADEFERLRLGQAPRNYYVAEHDIPSTPDITPEQMNDYLNKVKLQRKFYNHMPAREIKERVGKTIWNSYFKFTIERNPFDRAISQYYWEDRNGDVGSLDNFFRMKLYQPNYPIYSIDNNTVVDAVINYDTLENGLRNVCQRISLPFDGWLPNSKGGFRKNRDPWDKVLSMEQQEYIRREYALEFDVLEKIAI